MDRATNEILYYKCANARPLSFLKMNAVCFCETVFHLFAVFLILQHTLSLSMLNEIKSIYTFVLFSLFLWRWTSFGERQWKMESFFKVTDCWSLFFALFWRSWIVYCVLRNRKMVQFMWKLLKYDTQFCSLWFSYGIRLFVISQCSINIFILFTISKTKMKYIQTLKALFRTISISDKCFVIIHCNKLPNYLEFGFKTISKKWILSLIWIWIWIGKKMNWQEFSDSSSWTTFKMVWLHWNNINGFSAEGTLERALA